MPFTPSSSHLSFVKRIQFRCLELGDSIIKPSRSRPSATLFSEGTIVGPGLICDNFANIHSKGRSYGDIFDTSFPIDEHYLGFKTRRNNQTFYGWIKVESFGSNGIKVKEIAINKTSNKSILCGQKN